MRAAVRASLIDAGQPVGEFRLEDCGPKERFRIVESKVEPTRGVNLWLVNFMIQPWDALEADPALTATSPG